MKPYELTYIISSQLPAEGVDTLIKGIDSFIQENEGVIIKSEKTNAQTLAYSIKKNSSGYFVILEFKIGEDKIKALKEKLVKEKDVLRHFILVKHPAKKMKERRTRKPVPVMEPEVKGKTYTEEAPKSKVKVELGDIEKKLDEILSE